MKTAFLIYRPVMDYEESETPYFICLTKQDAEKAESEMIAFAKALMLGLESLYDEDCNLVDDDEYDKRSDRNHAKLKSVQWPFGIDLSEDFPWKDFMPSFNEGCVAVRELPLV